MSLTLPQRPAQYFIDEVLLPRWDPSEAVGFDPNAAPGDEAFLPVATSLDTVGASYPSLVVQFSSENSGGESTYDYLTPDGPGQNRLGTLLVTARAESERTYTGDANTYGGEDAEDLVVTLIEATENLIQRTAAGGSTEFQTIGSQRGPEAPDDTNVSPPVRLANVQVDYSWLRSP
jgi:hypothetical protein